VPSSSGLHRQTDRHNNFSEHFMPKNGSVKLELYFVFNCIWLLCSSAVGNLSFFTVVCGKCHAEV